MSASATIRLASYNILADAYATRRLYPAVPPRLLDWASRAPSIVARVTRLDPDVACLQEVQASHWSALHDALRAVGWSGLFAQKRCGRVDGCALLYRTGTVSLVGSEAVYYRDGSEPSGHLALMGVFDTAIGVVQIAGTHLRWQGATPVPGMHIGFRQAAELLARVQESDAVPSLVCGDFNVSAQHPALRLFIDDGFSDAYAASPQATCAPNGKASRIDFILASRTLRAYAEDIDVLTDGAVLPDGDEPSDHLPISARIESLAY